MCVSCRRVVLRFHSFPKASHVRPFAPHSRKQADRRELVCGRGAAPARARGRRKLDTRFDPPQRKETSIIKIIDTKQATSRGVYQNERTLSGLMYVITLITLIRLMYVARARRRRRLRRDTQHALDSHIQPAPPRAQTTEQKDRHARRAAGGRGAAGYNSTRRESSRALLADRRPECNSACNFLSID